MKIGVFSYLAGFSAYLFLTILLLKSWHVHRKGGRLVTASLMTTVWAGGIALQEAYGILSLPFVWTLELLHTYAWLSFLSHLLNEREDRGHADLIRRGIRILSLALAAFIWLSPVLGATYPGVVRSSDQFFGHLLMAIVGLVCVEQLFRNTRTERRWRIKLLCFSLGALFAYDFYLYSEALLLHRMREDLWTARGAVAAMTTPFIAISAARNPDWSVDIFVSRQMVFHAAALLGTTAYLLVMASAGYYLKFYGGEWGAATQILFLVAAFLLLALVLFSGHIRARVRIFVSKNFYSNAYDYREEWLRFIATLSDSGLGLSLERRVIRALAQVVESPGGVLWMREPTGRFSWRASCDAEDVDIPTIDRHDPVIQFLERKEWIVNLREMAAMPEVYNGLSKPRWLERCGSAWLLIPLFHQGKKMDGMVLLTQTHTPFDWNWEVIDMLKATGRLAASYLALDHAAKDLAEARQFDGFNRLSAFVIHDLKNLVAQLSLVVRNAEKHQDNPEFMRDAIQTVNHAVGKMNALMTQLRNSSSAVTTTECDLSALLREVAEARKKQLPPPQCELGKNPIMVSANRGRLAAALEHVIQNGQEAAGKQGRVVVRLRADDKQTAWIEVEDNGCGMDDHFIRTRLFKPFDTTKGLTGMGIGAYESREYVRSLGGELSVHSEPGKGSLFRFQIPLARTNLSFH